MRVRNLTPAAAVALLLLTGLGCVWTHRPGHALRPFLLPPVRVTQLAAAPGGASRSARATPTAPEPAAVRVGGPVYVT